MPAEKLYANAQSLQPSAEILLFQLSKYNRLAPNDTFYFTNYAGVVFGGISYVPLACQATGFQRASDGAVARPRLVVSDVQGLITALIYSGGSAAAYATTLIEGSELNIYKTARDFLDGYPLSDPQAYLLEDTFFVAQKLTEVSGEYIEYELQAPHDFISETIPARGIYPKCPYAYRGDECGYARQNGMFTITNAPTSDPAQDVCSRTLLGCKLRFGAGNIASGAFPGVRSF